MKKRANYLLLSDFSNLQSWAVSLRHMLKSYGVFQVGSSLTTKYYRDVDVRQIMIETEYQDLISKIDISILNHAISLWGQKVTGLPIDFQIQSIKDPDNKGIKTSL